MITSHMFNNASLYVRNYNTSIMALEQNAKEGAQVTLEFQVIGVCVEQ